MPKNRSNGPATLVVALVGLTLAGFSPAGDAVVGPQIRVDVGGGIAAANETTGGAVVGDDGQPVILGGWNDWRDSPTQGSEIVRTGFALSTDGGQTWNDFLIRPPASFQTGVEGDPMAAFDPRTDHLWAGGVAFGNGGGLYVARKNPGDDSFQPAVMVDTQSGIDKPWIVAGRNPSTGSSTRLYTAYNLGVARSDTLGDSWTSPVSLGPGLGFLPRVGPNGELYIAYWDFSADTFALKRSLDGGDTFVSRVIANRMDSWSVEENNPRFPGTFRVPPLAGLAVSPVDGSLNAVWPDTTGYIGGQANVDVYFSRSVDQGETWSTPIVVNDDQPFVGDQFFPFIEVEPTGRLSVVYLDSRNTDQLDNVVDGMLDAYLAFSEDNGSTWEELRLTLESWNSDDDGLNRPDQFIGDYLGLAVTEGIAWPIYPDSSSGDTDTYTNRVELPCRLPGEAPSLNVNLSGAGTDLVFNWFGLVSGVEYVLLEDGLPSGPFEGVIGTFPPGLGSTSIELPDGDRFYLLAAQNECGLGPR